MSRSARRPRLLSDGPSYYQAGFDSYFAPRGSVKAPKRGSWQRKWWDQGRKRAAHAEDPQKHSYPSPMKHRGGRRAQSRFKVGDRVKFRGRWGWEKTGEIVAEGGKLSRTPIWIIERTGATGRVVREHILEGDVIEVVGGRSARGRRDDWPARGEAYRGKRLSSSQEGVLETLLHQRQVAEFANPRTVESLLKRGYITRGGRDIDLEPTYFLTDKGTEYVVARFAVSDFPVEWIDAEIEDYRRRGQQPPRDLLLLWTEYRA